MRWAPVVQRPTRPSVERDPGARRRAGWWRFGIGAALVLGLVALISWPLALGIAVAGIAIWGLLWVGLVGGLSLVIKLLDWCLAVGEAVFDRLPTVQVARAEQARLHDEIAAHERSLRRQYPDAMLKVELERREDCRSWLSQFEAWQVEGALPRDDSLDPWRGRLAEHDRQIAFLRARSRELAAERKPEEQRQKARRRTARLPDQR